MDSTQERGKEARWVRREAQPHKWVELTGQQRQVIEQINDCLREYVSLPVPAEAKGRGLLQRALVEEHRYSNVVLIDGGRGSGKTSVMVTLLALWSRVLSGEGVEELLSEGQEDAGLRDRLREHLGVLQGRVLPVRILDLQPLPRSTALLPWLAGRILEVVELLEGPAAEGQRPQPIASWEPDWEGELKSRRAWQELVQDAAAGWDGNVGERKGALDPEAYAVELTQAERARLRVQERWRSFVTQVVADAHARHPTKIRKDTRLIVPIDDADMNPHHCVALLDLLRTLVHPQLVFVMTGDSQLFHKTLHLHYAGQFRRQLGRDFVTRMEQVILAERPTAQELAIQHYDKVLPRAQRFLIRRLEPGERLDKMKSSLKRFAVSSHLAPGAPAETLAGYFELNPYLRPGLPGSLRWLVDLQRRLESEREIQDTTQAVLELWRIAVAQEELAPEWREVLGRLLVRGRHGEVGINLSEAELSLSPVLERYDLPGLRRVAPHLQLRLITGLAGRLKRGPKEFVMPDRISALLALAYDLIVEGRQGAYLRLMDMQTLVPTLFVSLSQESQFRLVFPRLAESAPWPLPRWLTFLDMVLFSEAWRQKLEEVDARGEADPRGELAAFFLSTICDLMIKRKLRERKEYPTLTEAIGKLVDAMELIKQPQEALSLRQNALLKWLKTGPLLMAAPEGGLPVDVANQLLKGTLESIGKRDEKLRTLVVELHRARRRLGDQRFLPGTGSEDSDERRKQLEELDLKYENYLWGELVEGWSKSLDAQIKDLLGRIQIKHHGFGIVSKPQKLKAYVERFELQLSGGSKELGSLYKKLERLTPVSGGAQMAIWEMWQSFLETEVDTRYRSLIERKGTRISVMPLPDELSSLLAGEPVLLKEQIREHSYPIQAGGKISIYANRRESLPESWNYIRVAHAVVADENGEELIDGNLKNWHPELGRITGTFRIKTEWTFQGAEVGLRWPVPKWSSFYELSGVHRLMTSISNLMSVYSGELEMDIIHALAYSFLRGLGSVIVRKSPIVDVYMNIGRSQWGEVLHDFMRLCRDGRPRTERDVAIWEWMTLGVPLYATPEMGLPMVAANQIVESWGNLNLNSKNPNNKNDERWQRFVGFRKYMHRLRNDYAAVALKEAGLKSDRETVLRFLGEIERKVGQSHPWIAYFGPAAQEPAEEE